MELRTDLVLIKDLAENFSRKSVGENLLEFRWSDINLVNKTEIMVEEGACLESSTLAHLHEQPKTFDPQSQEWRDVLTTFWGSETFFVVHPDHRNRIVDLVIILKERLTGGDSKDLDGRRTKLWPPES
ncbi:hypothetical protein LEP1GSC126_0083 [Leptospira kirschneri str. 200801774]|uniref:hypothetical protein n=1 Tax=Leptospira kirschneri TaxID=29507 RepID=UPI0002C00AE0|nr:hypothetical protein [Leptospira kirschneri]EMO78601.1 hypothetical protein LEP1GSC126_0083 [Leptospira kirschneri str. 200801774]